VKNTTAHTHIVKWKKYHKAATETAFEVLINIKMIKIAHSA
jgi:hypothetical protein